MLQVQIPRRFYSQRYGIASCTRNLKASFHCAHWHRFFPLKKEFFKSQPKAVRNAFTQRLLQEEVDAEAMRERLVVKESLTQAFKEFREAEEAGVELPDARNLFK